MAPPPESDHDCGWRTYAKSLEERLTALEKALSHKSERRKKVKLPPALPAKPAKPDETKEKREAMAALRNAKLETSIEKVAVEPAECRCSKCGSTPVRELGEGKSSTVIEYVSPHFRKRVLMRALGNPKRFGQPGLGPTSRQTVSYRRSVDGSEGLATLKDPATTRDFMSYCNPTWVSDYTYRGLTSRVAHVNGVTSSRRSASSSLELHVIRVTEREMEWSHPVTVDPSSLGPALPGVVYDERGLVTAHVSLYRVDVSDGGGFALLVPPPRSDWFAVGLESGPALPYP